MPSQPSTPPQEIDTLPDGAAIITDEAIELSMSGDDVAEVFRLPVRRNFDEEPTRKAHAPKPPKTKEEHTDVVDVSSWESFRNRDDEPS